MLYNISAVIIAFNEEKIIGLCISALKDVVDEIVVIDGFSTDQTVEICTNSGAIVYQLPWKGYSKTKNEGNTLAKHDMILSIDADEIPDQYLIDEIKSLRKFGFASAYRMRRKNFYGQKWVRFGGWYPDKKIRIFNKNIAQWKGDFVHEQLVLDTQVKVETLTGHIHHYTVIDHAHHVNTIRKYAALAAKNAIKHNKHFTFLWALRSCITTFLKIYVVKLGVLDGKVGFSIALNSARSKWLRYQFYINKKKKTV